MKKILIAALAVVSAALAIVLVLTERNPSPRRDAPSVRRAPEPPVGRDPGEGAPPVAAARALSATEPKPPAPGQPPPPEPAGTAAPEALPADPNARLRALEPLRGEVFAGLAGLRGRIAHCEAPGVLVLVTLETLDGAVRVEKVRVEPRPAGGEGGETAEADEAPVDERIVHCLRSALVGNVVGAPSASPGRRWEMLLDAAAPE